MAKKVTTGKTLYNQVVERINTMIVQGIYRQGDLLPSEKELMEMMGVGRITIRESLRILNESGVIQTVKGKGSFVSVDFHQISQSQAFQNYRRDFMESTDTRILLEPAVARLVAETCGDETRLSIGQCLTAESGVLENFHRSIIQAAHNQLLLSFFDQLTDVEGAQPTEKLLPPFRQKAVAEKFQVQHERIFEAIRDKKGEYAYFYMKEHLEFVKRTYEDYFQSLCS